MTSVPIRRPRVCEYCPEGTGIIFNPDDAMKMHDGTWKCLKCIDVDTKKTMLGPQHPKVKDEKESLLVNNIMTKITYSGSEEHVSGNYADPTICYYYSYIELHATLLHLCWSKKLNFI
jgi:hypothetical protein